MKEEFKPFGFTQTCLSKKIRKGNKNYKLYKTKNSKGDYYVYSEPKGFKIKELKPILFITKFKYPETKEDIKNGKKIVKEMVNDLIKHCQIKNIKPTIIGTVESRSLRSRKILKYIQRRNVFPNLKFCPNLLLKNLRRELIINKEIIIKEKKGDKTMKEKYCKGLINSKHNNEKNYASKINARMRRYFKNWFHINKNYSVQDEIIFIIDDTIGETYTISESIETLLKCGAKSVTGWCGIRDYC